MYIRYNLPLMLEEGVKSILTDEWVEYYLRAHLAMGEVFKRAYTVCFRIYRPV